MPEIQVINNNSSLAASIEYEFGDETIEEILAKYDKSLKKQTSSISVGGEVIKDWDMPISVALHYGEFISTYCYDVQLTVKRAETECKVKMDARESVWCLHSKICELFKEKSEYQLLKLNDKAIETRGTLWENSIDNESVIVVEDKPINIQIQVLIASQAVDMVKLERVYPNESIIEMKQRISKILGIDVENQKLELDKTELEDHSNVRFYKIGSRSKIVLYFKQNEKIISSVVTLRKPDGEILTVNVDKNTKVRDLKQHFNQKFVYFNYQFRSDVRMLQENRNITEYDLVNNKVPICAFYEWHILIATQSDEIYKIETTENCRVEELRKKIEQLTGIPETNIRLIAYGKQVEGYGGETLYDNCIQYGDTIHLILTLSGGGCGIDFADLESRPRIHDWSNDAPEWRAASRGLCLEGKCINKTCSAHRKMVIMNMGMPICYQLGMPSKKETKCPKCKQHVKPITCGFNNCEWRFLGIKETGDGPRKIKSDWKIVGDKYHRFNEEKKCNWTSLVIETKDSYDSLTNQVCCAICLSSREDDSKPYQLIKCENCTGKVHSICMGKWKKLSRGCPTCRYASA